MAHPCPVRPYECFNTVCPKHGCLLERVEKREREKAQEALNTPEALALIEANSIYEKIHAQAVRTDKVKYREPTPITRANPMLAVFEPEEFDVLTLLSKR